MNEGRECDIADAHVNASSNVDFSRKPPKIMKLWRFRYCGSVLSHLLVYCWRWERSERSGRYTHDLDALDLGAVHPDCGSGFACRGVGIVIVDLLEPQCVDQITLLIIGRLFPQSEL